MINALINKVHVKMLDPHSSNDHEKEIINL